MNRNPSQTAQLEALLPHRRTMLLLSELVSVDDRRAASRTVIAEQCTPFALEDGSVSASVLIELMAQTVGLYAGNRSRSHGKSPQIGFLLGARRLTSDISVLTPGTVVDVEVECLFLDDTGELPSQFACLARIAGRVVSEANLTVFQPNDIHAFESPAS